MRYIFLLAGGILLFASSISIGRYIFYYTELSDYGKGFIWGKVILFAGGLILLYFGLKKRKKTLP